MIFNLFVNSSKIVDIPLSVVPLVEIPIVGVELCGFHASIIEKPLCMKWIESLGQDWGSLQGLDCQDFQGSGNLLLSSLQLYNFI